MNFLDWESKLRTWLTATDKLEFIDGPWPQKLGLRVEDPRLALVYVEKLSKGKDIAMIILQNVLPNLRNGLECLASLDLMNAIWKHHKMYDLMDM